MNTWFNRREAPPKEGLPLLVAQAVPSPNGDGFTLEPPTIRAAPKPKPRYVTGLEPAHMEATFAGGTRVQLRNEQPWRWCMWVTTGGAWKRRKDFSSPFAGHACRAAEQWYGPPTIAWHPAETEDL
jgi:hypothetical protein